MKKNKLFQILFSIILIGLFACSGSTNQKVENNDTIAPETTEKIVAQEIADKVDKPIIELLRSLDEDTYGGVSHIKDNEFSTVDNENMFVEYRIEEGQDLYIMTFKQIAFGDRNIFAKSFYDRYDSGNMGYFQSGSFVLIEYKDGKWINLEKEMPEKWGDMDFAYFLSTDNNNILKYRFKLDKKGNILNKELVETASWKEGKFTRTGTDTDNNNENYKIIVAYTPNPEDVSEDWNFFYNDISTAFKDKGIYVVINEGNKAIVQNADLSVEIDLDDILKKNNISSNCYIFLRNDKEAKCVDYDMSDEVIKQAKVYYK